MDAELKKEFQAMIDDALAGAGEQFAAQAKSAATEAITAGTENITQQIAALDGKVAEVAKAKPTGVDTGQLAELVNGKVAEALAAREADAAKAAEAQAAKAKVIDARNTFLKEKAAKIPEAYRAAIPETDDPEQLQAGLQRAVASLRADAKAYGFALPELGQPAGEGQQPAPTSKSREELAAMSREDRNAYLASVKPQA
jgi:hypothetical protein